MSLTARSCSPLCISMDIFTEIRTKISRRVLKWAATPADHKRPQDDVPDETVLRHLYADYQRLSRERSILIHYIRRMEKIYEESKVGMFRLSTRRKGTRSRIRQELCLLAYNVIKEHLDAQTQLRKELEMEDYEQDDKTEGR